MNASAISPASFQEPKLQALAVLYQAKSAGTDWLSAVEVSQKLREAHGLNVHWKSIQALLSGDKASAHRQKRNGQWRFSIMQPGIALLQSNSNDITYVDPSQAVPQTMRLHSLLSTLKGTIRVCDPYLDVTTLEHLDACTAKAPIRLLTKNFTDSGPLRRLVAAVKVNRPLEIRKTAAPLHDRYILDDADMMILGTSLNGFGKKQCFVIKAGSDVRATLLIAFDASWTSAAPWP